MFVALVGAAPAMAQRVELMSFNGTAAAAVSPEASVLTSNNPTDLTASMANGFSEMTSRPAALEVPDVPSLTAGMSIPLWMRTGVPRSAGPTSSPVLTALPALAATCADALYRPRHDLPASTEARRAKLFPLVAQVACEAGIPAGLFDALVGQESRYRWDALSPKGAAGLTQLMPGTARDLGVRNPWNVAENLRGGARYLKTQLNEFGRVDLALAAYNAGPGRVRSHRRVPRIRETVNYVFAITQAWSASLPRFATVLPANAPLPPPPRTARNPFRTAELISYTLPNTSKPM